MSGASLRGGGARPALPAGRDVRLRGRGRTFVRELAGPPEAPAVVLLHGWAATADLNWFACYEALARHFRIVAPDHRGHGRGLRAADPFLLADCADDVAALLPELGIDRCIPVGYSMGGSIAQLLWRRHPQLVRGLVLCATSTHFAATVRDRLLFGVATGTSAFANVMPLRPFTGAALVTWRGWQALRGRPWWGFDELDRHDWHQVVLAGRETGRFDSRPWIGGFEAPAAVIVTDDDDVVPTGRQLALAAAIEQASVRRVPGGHAACTAAADTFVPALVSACLDVAGRDSPDGERGVAAA